MTGNGLIDTGAILALLDRSDRWHQRCMDALSQLRMPLSTSEAVLTELFHLVGDNSREVRAAWKFVRSGALTISPVINDDLPALDALMHQYRDRPMDFADATLVHIAQRESLTLILTIDRNDFETYRIKGRQRFRIVPSS
jgi:predicted nucleic acid-binding protein